MLDINHENEKQIADHRLLLSNVLELQGDLPGAEMNLIKAVRIHPSLETLNALGHFYLRHHELNTPVVESMIHQFSEYPTSRLYLELEEIGKLNLPHTSSVEKAIQQILSIRVSTDVL
jgi:hypothetical protein